MLLTICFVPVLRIYVDISNQIQKIKRQDTQQHQCIEAYTAIQLDMQHRLNLTVACHKV